MKAIAAAYALTASASALSATPVRRTPAKAGRGHSAATPIYAASPTPSAEALAWAELEDVRAHASHQPPRSRRSHLLNSVTAPVAAAVGAKGLGSVAQALAARRQGDVVVLDRVTRHVQELFAEDAVLATAASFSILTRIKTAVSADQKLRSKSLNHVDDLRDVAGVRVVVDEGARRLDEEAGYALCYRVLRRLASSPHVREVTDLKDYVRAPKANGYRSLHATIVPTSARLPQFEIQVRTRAMDAACTYGAAAHRAYKLASSA